MKKLGLALFCLFFALANSSVAVADSLYTRNLSCDSWTAPREQEICKALAREMQWTWTGHAIISPSFRVTFDTVKQVYCALSVSPQDIQALVNMIVALERKPDGSMARAQAVNGARFLLFLLGQQALTRFPPRDNRWDDLSWQIVSNLKEEVKSNSSDPGMIWNPANPQYLLRNGCR